MHILAGGGARIGSSTHSISRARSVYCAAQSGEASRRSGRREKQTCSDLRNLKGVGRVNEEKLISKGIDSLETLRQALVEECNSDEQEAVNYLKAKVGIRQKRHCETIVAQLLGGPRLTVCVEGNISAGKSTFLQIVRGNNEQLEQQLQVVPEPVDQWQNAPMVNAGTTNLLDQYYQSPSDNAYIFQTYVFLTRVFQEADSRISNKRFRLMERSVFSDRMVFVRKLKADSLLNDEQLGAYDGILGPLLSRLDTAVPVDRSPLVPDGFIYLRAQPQTCMRRMKRRSRGEEEGVPQDYLESLHANHEDWLFGKDVFATTQPFAPDAPVTMLGKDSAAAWTAQRPPPPPPECIKDDLKWVFAEPVQLVTQALGQVPVLVLEMDQDLDLDRDLEAKQKLSAKVAAYFTYMQQYKDQVNQAVREGQGRLYLPTPAEARAITASARSGRAENLETLMQRDHSSPMVGNEESLVKHIQPRRAWKPSDKSELENLLEATMQKMMPKLRPDDLGLLYSLVKEKKRRYTGTGFEAMRDLVGALDTAVSEGMLMQLRR